MIHFLYLVGFALFVGIVFGSLYEGTTRQRVLNGLKTFLEFVGISLIIAWILYFIPW